jgi:Ca-activated chloride channel family protein
MNRAVIGSRMGLLPLVLVLVVHAAAQPAARQLADNVVVPQSAALQMRVDAPPVELTRVAANIAINEQVATTTLDIHLRNPGPRPTEAELLVPVPDGAVLRGFAFAGAAAAPTAEVLPHDAARTLYEDIVARLRDPALVEFAGWNLLRSSVFPVPPGGEQQVRLIYEHVLPRDGRRVDYVLPRTESLAYKVPWEISVTVQSQAPVATVYSPSHNLDVERRSATSLRVTNAADARAVPGPFRLSYLVGGGEVTASLMAYPNDGDGGYFLLLAGLPADLPSAESMRRELTLVLDQSGSMRGEKIAQARAAAEQVVAGLRPGEMFNIITYNTQVRQFAPEPVARTPETLHAARAFLQQTGAGGNTDIHAALTAALRPAPAEDVLPIVLFLTDGLPTAGNTSEVAIRRVATDQNPGERRIFTFGVGADVNTPLLQKIASETRGTATFVLPGEQVEAKVAAVFDDLQGPVLTSAALEAEPSALASAGGPIVPRVGQLMPATLPDLYSGDQLVVLGRYYGDAPLSFTLAGAVLGQPRTFEFTFPLDNASTRNAFVPRLWASRRIAHLVDEIRQMGADAPPAVLTGSAAPGAAPSAAGTPADARVKELVDEIVALSTEFGILTEYTAFLAREGTNLADAEAVEATATDNLKQRAMAMRSGLGAVSQAVNGQTQQRQQALNHSNAFVDQQMERVEITSVQQINDRAFFRRGARWVDSRAVQREGDLQPDRTVVVGTAAFNRLVARLAAENRAGTIALPGEVLLQIDGEIILVQPPTAKVE